MTYGSSSTVLWICNVCDGAEETEPGAEPPTPPVCPTCYRLTIADLLSDWTAW